MRNSRAACRAAASDASAAARVAASRAAASGFPSAGTSPPKARPENPARRLARLPSTSARSLFTSAANRATEKSTSPVSGALATSHHRHASAGSSSRAASAKIPRPALVENLPPSKDSQWKPLMTSAVRMGSPDPSSVAGKLTAWKGTLSLPRNCTRREPSPGAHQSRQSRPGAAAAHSRVAAT